MYGISWHLLYCNSLFWGSTPFYENQVELIVSRMFSTGMLKVWIILLFEINKEICFQIFMSHRRIPKIINHLSSIWRIYGLIFLKHSGILCLFNSYSGQQDWLLTSSPVFNFRQIYVVLLFLISCGTIFIYLYS